jgi:hypothetical protein
MKSKFYGHSQYEYQYPYMYRTRTRTSICKNIQRITTRARTAATHNFDPTHKRKLYFSLS